MKVDLTVAERRDLLELYAELSSLDPTEFPKGKPWSQPLLGPEIVALRKVIAAALTGPAPTDSKGWP